LEVESWTIKWLSRPKTWFKIRQKKKHFIHIV